jgi:hypothetical protein
MHDRDNGRRRPLIRHEGVLVGSAWLGPFYRGGLTSGRLTSGRVKASD